MGEAMDILMDFHLLIFLMVSDLLPLKNCMPDLCKALKNKDKKALHHWINSEEWNDSLQIIAAHGTFSSTGSRGARMEQSPTSSASAVEYMDTDQDDEPSWTCSHCTF